MSDVIKDLSELRLSYEQGELHEGQVESNPHQQFLGWFNHALAANLHEPYAMSLATASANGRPHVRTVLLRGATEAGYDFILITTVKRYRFGRKSICRIIILLAKSRASGASWWSCSQNC